MNFSYFKDLIKALGLVFGDIGTSPLYTLSVVFLLVPPTKQNITGVCSLIVWTLILMVIVEYTILAMSLSKKGEGGTIVLKEILVPLLKNNRQVVFVSTLCYVGISLLCGDGIITPAITILSAIEGIQLIPFFKNLSTNGVIFITVFIVILLFTFQKKGSDKVSSAFGPLMLIWFFTIGISGLVAITQNSFVLDAINPLIAIKFLTHQKFTAFLLLSEVILCATGGEALYADMGHLGPKPIKHASYFVLITLLLSYLGQGAFVFSHPNAQNILHEMIYYQAKFLYIPFFILCIIASVIASQAMISGLFSIVYQGITTKILPTFKIDYTSSRLRSQVYISAVNWFLCTSVIAVIFMFKASKNLAAAYGLAVTVTMSVTGIMMTSIFYLQKKYIKAFISYFITCLDILFLFSNLFKIPHGGYISLIIASIPLALIFIYTKGQQKVRDSVKPILLDDFIEKYNKAYPHMQKIKGTAIFCVKRLDKIAPYVYQTLFKNGIMYQDNIMLIVKTTDQPFGVKAEFEEDMTNGLRIFSIEMGYMDVIDIEKILTTAGINAKVIFYGLEEIITTNIIWKIFSAIKRLTPSFVYFYKLPHRKLHGVLTPIEM